MYMQIIIISVIFNRYNILTKDSSLVFFWSWAVGINSVLSVKVISSSLSLSIFCYVKLGLFCTVTVMLWHCGNKSILTSLKSLKQNLQEPITNRQHKQHVSYCGLNELLTLPAHQSRQHLASFSLVLFTVSTSHSLQETIVKLTSERKLVIIWDIWTACVCICVCVSCQPAEMYCDEYY